MLCRRPRPVHSLGFFFTKGGSTLIEMGVAYINAIFRGFYVKKPCVWALPSKA
jgi:hypothetical protein